MRNIETIDKTQYIYTEHMWMETSNAGEILIIAKIKEYKPLIMVGKISDKD